MSFSHSEPTTFGALGIEEGRAQSLLDRTAPLFSKLETLSLIIEEIMKWDDLTPLERAFVLYKIGEYVGRAAGARETGTDLKTIHIN